MATFPSYATILADGFSETVKNMGLRTEMEAGIPKQALTRSKPMIERKITILFDSLANYNLFKAWFATDINYGASWFDWTDPLTGTVKQARFIISDMTAMPLDTMDTWEIQTTIETWG